MAEERAQRRLAAILAADVVGYSRLIQQDEAGTLAALKARRKGVLAPLVANHHGRIVKVMGDGVLIEFGSAVNAVACAVELQNQMAAANGGVADDRRIALRIGINLGDLVVEGGDLYGDGVIIAVRLQAMAEPGGICISGSVHEQLGNKLPLAFADLGPCEVKNIAKPVRTFRVRVDHPEEVIRSAERQPTQNRPSIAVLPFANLSAERDQGYLSDGITEDIITELSRFTSLFVIARNSSFQYRDKPMDLKQVGRELGARYIVEGSVRRLGPQIRITAQLIDSATGGHLWAERYDRGIADLFAVQDDVVRSVVTALSNRVADSEEKQALRKPPQSWVAYDYVLQARQHMADHEYLRAEGPLRRSIELDASIAEPYALLAFVLDHKYRLDEDVNHLEEAFRCAKKAIALNSQGSGPQFAMAAICSSLGRYAAAGFHYDRAIALNPNNNYARLSRAQWMTWGGRCEEALAEIGIVFHGQSVAPAYGYYWEALGETLFHLRRYQEAIDALGKSNRSSYWVEALMVAALAHAGRSGEAHQQLTALLESQPKTTIARVLKVMVYEDEGVRGHLVEGLRKAEMPE